MKRFSKVFSGIAAIMLGFGIMLIAMGFGSARRDWEEVMGSQQGFDQMEKSFDGVEHLDLDILFGYIELGISEDNKVHFRALNIKEDTVEIEQEGSELEICMEEDKDSPIQFSLLPYITIMGWAKKSDEFSAPRYEVLLPKNYNGTLKISMGTGFVRADGIEARRMEFFVDAGELVVRECSAEKLKAECKLGDCVVDGLFQDIETRSHIGIQEISLYHLKEDYDGIISCNIGQLDYFNPIPISEERIWEANCQEGFHLYEKWKGKNREGNLKIKCDIGQVSVRFAKKEVPMDRGTATATTESELDSLLQDMKIPELDSLLQDMKIPELDSLLPGTDEIAIPPEATTGLIDEIMGAEYEFSLEDIFPEDVEEAISDYFLE